MTATRPGKALAQELQAKSRSDALHLPMARLIEAVVSHALTEAPYFPTAWSVVGDFQAIHHGFEVTPEAGAGEAICLESGPVPAA